jgi:hypothetical protein
MDALHVMVETAARICGCHERNDDGVFVVWANKLTAMLIGHCKEVRAQHLNGAHFQLWII